MTTLALASSVSQKSQKTTLFRTLEMKFGNGYGQRTADGYNDTVDTWKIEYSPLNGTDRATVWTFLNTVKSTSYFTWTAPGDSVEKKWIVDPTVMPSEQALAGDVYVITFQAKQVFDL